MLPTAWPHATGYELTAGEIAPAARARFEACELSIEFAREAYRELCYLVRRFRDERGLQGFLAPGEKVAERNEAILDWCSRFGLLGLLFHRVQLVRFRPTWERIAAKASALVPRQLVLRIQPPHGLLWEVAHHSRVRRDVEPGAQLTEAELRALPETFRPQVVRLKLTEPRTEAESVASGFARYFERERLLAKVKPAVLTGDADFALAPLEDATTYPEPYSAKWWRTYREPLSEFEEAAFVFADAFYALAESHSSLSAEQAATAERRLRVLASLGQPGVALSGEQLVWRWEGMSLLAALAFAARQDLAGTARTAAAPLRVCVSCGKPYQRAHRQSRYCSETCLKREAMRRYRRRLRRRR